MRDGAALEDLPPVYQKPYLAVERATKGPERAHRNNVNHVAARESIASNREQATTAAQLNRQIKEDKALLVDTAKNDPSWAWRTAAKVTDATSFRAAEKFNDQVDGARQYYADRKAHGDKSWGTRIASGAVEVGDSFGFNRIYDHRSSVAQTQKGIEDALITGVGGPVGGKLIGKAAQGLARTKPMAAADAWLGTTRPGAWMNQVGTQLVKARSLPPQVQAPANWLAKTGPGKAMARVGAELEKPRSLSFRKPAAPAPPARQLVHPPPADATQFHFGDAAPVRLKGYVATDADRAAWNRSSIGRDFGYDVMEKARPAGAPVLPREEAAALLEYTGDGYRQLNKALWTNNPTFMAEQENMARMVSSALSQAPKHEGLVYRGACLTEEQAAVYRSGEVVTQRSFSSSSTSREAIAPYQVGHGVKMEYQIQSRTGRDLTGLTAHPAEGEILFQPGTQFRVEGVERATEGGRAVMRVRMSEVL